MNSGLSSLVCLSFVITLLWHVLETIILGHLILVRTVGFLELRVLVIERALWHLIVGVLIGVGHLGLVLTKHLLLHTCRLSKS